MSIVCLSYVMRFSEARLGARLVLFTLAEHAHDDGSKAFPAVETLMQRTRLSRSAVKASLKTLRDDGAIVETGQTRQGVNVYRVVMERGSDSDRGSDLDRGQIPTEGGSDSGPNPSVEPPSSSSGGALPKIAGRKVDRATWELAVAVLGAFNVHAGKRLAPTTGTGAPSEAAKRIYQRVKEWPDLSLDDYERIIRRTLASKWWGEDSPSVGVVFGPRVFEENMERPEPAASAQRASFERTKGSVEEDEI